MQKDILHSFLIFPMLLLLLSPLGCNEKANDEDHIPKVEVRKEGDTYTLYRDGNPYYIKGAGGQSHLDVLVNSGGNSIRTWGANNGEEHLQNAEEKGLTVLMGLWVGHERHGFNYNDEEAVADQLAKFSLTVKKLKNYPSLLMWGIGNEVNLNYSNLKVWDAINDLAKMIHETDPNHPTMTVTAGISQELVDAIKERAPEIDVLGVNSYGDVVNVPDKIREYGWDKPYVVTEWGPNGHWEVPHTQWDAPIEPNSTAKAEMYRNRYAIISGDKQQNLGSYVFTWGQKQERTPTWYGLFTEEGLPLGAVDAMQYSWTGEWPENRAPELDYLYVNGKSANQNVRLQAGQQYEAVAAVTDPDQDDMIYKWEVLHEATEVGSGGDAEPRPDAVDGLFVDDQGKKLTFKAPSKSGAYRIFFYAKDSNNKVATANVPFYVE